MYTALKCHDKNLQVDFDKLISNIGFNVYVKKYKNLCFVVGKRDIV